MSLSEFVARKRQTLRYIFAPRPWPLELPVVVQFPINDICDSKCQMCNIWQQKLGDQITVEQARTIYSNPLFRRVVAVGLNGGEPTLRRDLAELGDMLFRTLPRLKVLSLITNGLHAQRAIERIDGLAHAVSARGGRLDVMVSLDGVGAVHDRVRGAPGNFENAVKVLDHILARPDRITARVACTVIADNVYHVHELLDFCRSRQVYVKFRLGVPNRRLYNLPPPPPKQIGKRIWIDTHPFDLDAEQRWHFGQFLYELIDDYEPALQQRQFYASLAGQVIEGQPRRAGCDWQHRGVTVSSRGEILYCAVQSDVLGNGLEESAEELYFGNQRHLQAILTDKCASCAHDYVGPPGGRAQAALIAEGFLRKFNWKVDDLKQSRLVEALVSLKRFFAEPIRFAKSRRALETVAREAPMKSEKNGVLICGWYGTETLGDKAILATIVNTIRNISPDERVDIASLNATYTRLTVDQMPELEGCEVIAPQAAMASIGRYSTLIFGGGPLMAVREMSEMEALFVAAAARGVRTIVAGCGVGPLGASFYRKSIGNLLSAARLRIFRDTESRVAAADLLGTHEITDAVCEDPAATWVADQEISSRGTESAPMLALGLRDWPYYQYAPKMSRRRARALKEIFENSVIAALERLLAEIPALRIAPVPFCTHRTGGDDRVLYWRLVRRSSMLRAAFDLSLISRELSPAEYLSRINSCDAMLTMRFHSLVFANTLGIPTFAIDYTLGSGKTHALASRTASPMIRFDRIDANSLYSGLRTALNTRRARPGAELKFKDTFREILLEGGLIDRARNS